ELRGGGNVGVVAGADILQIDQDDVDRIECGACTGTRSLIKTVDWKTGARVSAVRNPRAILGALKAVLGTEQQHKPCAVRREQDVHVASARPIDAGVIRQETEAFAGDEMSGV